MVKPQIDDEPLAGGGKVKISSSETREIAATGYDVGEAGGGPDLGERIERRRMFGSNNM